MFTKSARLKFLLENDTNYIRATQLELIFLDTVNAEITCVVNKHTLKSQNVVFFGPGL